MDISLSSIRCALQVALLGAITKNLRAINVNLNESLVLYFYYENNPSNEEEELSEIVASELAADFLDKPIKVNRIVISMENQIPDFGIRIFHRFEKF